jgi:hypothetical protein
MTTREELTYERLDALLKQLETLQNLSEFRKIRNVSQLGEAQQAVKQRQKAVSDIVTDYQTARSNFDTAVTDYQNASTVSEEFAAVVAATQAQQAQIDEIVEYLVLTDDALGGSA